MNGRSHPNYENRSPDFILATAVNSTYLIFMGNHKLMMNAFGGCRSRRQGISGCDGAALPAHKNEEIENFFQVIQGVSHCARCSQGCFGG